MITRPQILERLMWRAALLRKCKQRKFCYLCGYYCYLSPLCCCKLATANFPLPLPLPLPLFLFLSSSSSLPLPPPTSRYGINLHDVSPGDALYNDLVLIYRQLHIVDNNSRNSKGGGGTPLQPPLPPICGAES